jgi:hypothetical protein
MGRIGSGARADVVLLDDALAVTATKLPEIPVDREGL